MGKRVREGALSSGAQEGFTPEGVPVPPSGRFQVLRDRRSPLHWELRLEPADGAAASWVMAGGLPPRPGEGRVAAHAATLPSEEVEAWDEGAYEARQGKEGAWTLRLDGRRVRGRYHLQRDGDVWTLERVDDESVRPFPEHALPMLAVASPYPADEVAYAFEVKWDGIRALAHVRHGRLRLHTRNLNDVTAGYPELADLPELLRGRDAVLDGEIVAFDEKGLPSFQKLQGRLGVVASAMVRRRRDEVPVVYMVFDLLHLDDRDVTQLPYEERRGLLESLDLAGPHVQVSPSFRGQGKVLLATPGLEGVVAKRLGSPYEPGARSRAWLKVKTQRRQELVIGGWTPGKGARRGRIGSLLVGYHDQPRGTEFRYAGNVGTGFTEQALDDLQRLLEPFRMDASPFSERVPKKDATFVEPKFVCEVEFSEWTSDGKLRHPSFKGLREDKDPRDVVREES